MTGNGAGQLRVAVPGQPRRRTVAVGQRACRVVARERLVGVVEQRGAIRRGGGRRRPAGVDPRGEPARHLGDRARVPHEPGRGIQGEQQGGGVHPPRHRHRLDGTRRSATAAVGSAGVAAGRLRRRGRARGRGRSPGSRTGTPAAHRGRVAVVALAGRGAGVAAGAGTLGPDGHPAGSKPTTTVPSRSVRSTRAPGGGEPIERGLRRVPVRVAGPGRRDGDPGRTASTNACVVAVRLP